MRTGRIVVLATLAMVTLVGCAPRGTGPGASPGGSNEPPTTGPPLEVQTSADIYAAVIGSDPGSSKLWIVDKLCPDADQPSPATTGCVPIPADLRAALEQRLPGALFTHDPEAIQDRYLKGDLAMGDAGGTIWWLGPIDGSGERVGVPASYWCGGLCGSGATHIVEFADGTWTVTGSTGPVWMS